MVAIMIAVVRNSFGYSAKKQSLVKFMVVAIPAKQDPGRNRQKR